MGIRIGSVVRNVGLAGVLVFALAGCGGADPASDAVDAAKEIVKEAEGAGTSDGAAAEPVDTCELFTADDFASVAGAPAAGPPEKNPPSGSYLGGCMYFSADATVGIQVSARPAGEWEGSVRTYGDGSVSGVGEKAVWAEKAGLFVLPAGKPYFLHVLAMPDTSKPATFGKELSIEVGKLAAER